MIKDGKPCCDECKIELEALTEEEAIEDILGHGWSDWRTAIKHYCYQCAEKILEQVGGGRGVKREEVWIEIQGKHIKIYTCSHCGREYAFGLRQPHFLDKEEVFSYVRCCIDKILGG